MRKFVFCLCLVVSSGANALGDGPSIMAVVTELKKQYTLIMKQLKEARAASDTLRSVYDVSGKMYDEYKFVKNFSAEAEINNILKDIDGLTGLDELGEVDAEGKFRLLRAEINRRFTSEDQAKEAALNRLSEIERLEKLKQKKLQEAADASGGKLTMKGLQSSMASSNALWTAWEIEKKQKKLRKEMRAAEVAQDAKKYKDGFVEFLEEQ